MTTTAIATLPGNAVPGGGNATGIGNGNERAKRRGLWRQFLTFYRTLRIPWWLYAISFVIGIVYGDLTVRVSSYSVQLYNGKLGNGIIIGYVALTVGNSILALAQGMTSAYAEQRTTRNARNLVWGRILRLPLRVIEQDNPSSYVSGVTTSVTWAGYAITSTITLASSLYAFGKAFIVLFQYNARLTGFLLLLVPVFILLFVLGGRLFFAAAKRYYDGTKATTEFFSEHLANIRYVKAQNAVRDETAQGDAAIDVKYRAGLFMGLIYAVIVPINTLYGTISSIAVAVFGSGMIRRRELPHDGINVFSTYLGNVNTQLQQIVVQYQAIKGAQGGLEHSGDIMSLPVETIGTGESGDEDASAVGNAAPIVTPNAATPDASADETSATATVDGDLVVDDVTYAYPDGRLALRDVSLVIPHGKRTVIVGGNGAGKSTLLKLLLRLYEPTSGLIGLRDGKADATGETGSSAAVPAADIALDRYRAAFGYAPQHPYIFAGTVGQNLAYGLGGNKTTDADEPLRQAADLSRVPAFPDGLDTMLNEGGSNVSGGEAQRIALGRAVAGAPRFLLLDEATSAVDHETAARILSDLDARKDRWTIVQVTHDPSQARSADYVVVLNGGTVEAAGAPDEVARTSPYYRRFAA
ncbi:ABC transporter ATP-binding protein [Bifidobacterium biavatii]|uniref:Putative ABC transporter, permease/ATP-binding protein n=1 Tax=Bifidobacterium biavatii DSM 23969 TaxID=1437608 RepID=A0A086ZYK6_9BIFI|nr:ABC transporter ATP-binding protein [Bifidobacterium biavatii]KFI51606.1 putative ABC transporter, permease/ATP-binding protein [Bifidobacterium biavatii DSM 23969]